MLGLTINFQDFVSQASKVCLDVGNPSQKHREAMSKLFPSSSATKRLRSDAFDPTWQCAAFHQQQKKKKTRPKPSKVTVFLVPVGSRCVPRGKHRKNLIDKKCMVKIDVFRDMSGEKVKETILKAFEHLELPSFVYMSVDVSHKLWKDPEQSKDGSMLADLGRHGSIYIEKQLDVS